MTKTSSSKISVIGAGAWGTALSILLAEKGQAVTLWVFEKELAAQLQASRENKIFLPGFPLAKSIEITTEAEKNQGADIFLFAVPTQFLRSVAGLFTKVINSDAVVVCASKGIEEKSLKLPLDILKDEFKTDKLAALSGPNLSREIARGLPAASVIAAQDIKLARLIQETFMLERFRIYANSDPLGCQLGGALKNIIAIAAGIADGLGLGNNAKAGLMIRGLAETSRLGAAMGADPKTFAGLSGMGDLITTCSSKLSRNHFIGEQIAGGKKLAEILARSQAVAEGVPTCKAALALGEKHRVQLPVTQQVSQILFAGKKPFQAICDLMTRTPTTE